MRINNQGGYTLIEVIVALALFAIVSTLSATIIRQAFDTRAHLVASTDRLNTVELVAALLQRDTAHMINRAIRSTDKQLFPPFVGEANYVEFTRGGVVNPNAMDQRSTLKRVAWLCENQQLIRRTWRALDGPSHHDFLDNVLLEKVSDCAFNYRNHNLEQLAEWRPYALGKNQLKESLPSAIELTISIEQLGEAHLLFVIPEGLYGT
jgi:general secretion pathway protein J